MKFTRWSLAMLMCLLLCHRFAFTLSSKDNSDVPQDKSKVLSKKEDDTKAEELKKIQETETDSKSVDNLEGNAKKDEEAHQEGQDDSVESEKNIFSRGINNLASSITKFSVYLVTAFSVLTLIIDITSHYFLPAFKGDPTFSWNALLNDTKFQKKVELLKLKKKKKKEADQLSPVDLLEKCQQLMHSYWYLLLIGIIFICVSTLFIANNRTTRRRRQIRVIQMSRSRLAALKKKERGSKTRKKRKTNRRNGRANQ